MSNQELLIIRGLPGSGKSTLAERMSFHNDWVHIETDMFFLDYHGNYVFQPEKIAAAHQWCQAKVYSELEDGDSVIVSNTFSRIWEMQPYLDMAKEFDCKLTVLTVEGNHGSVHSVPQESIDKMKARWEKYDV